MKDFTTIEKLQMKVSATYGSVLKFGSHVLVTDAHYKGGFTEQTFIDNGHAIAWCMEQTAK